ncbi:MAG: hypothetical protein M3394_01245 [Actinomycetota bacterium]|nr:hypothetical protein [Actinomycetota bacterium]
MCREDLEVTNFGYHKRYRREDIDHLVFRRRFRLWPVRVLGLVGADGVEKRTYFSCVDAPGMIRVLEERGWPVIEG